MYFKLLGVLPVANNNYVAFTFFIGTMAMMAAAVFFFFEMSNVDKKWRTSILVSGLITFIAAVHYYYMRGYNLETGESPVFFRYVDWILTVLFNYQKSRCKNWASLAAYFCVSSNAGNRLHW